MGRRRRFQPEKLADKLRFIRERLGLTKSQIFQRIEEDVQSSLFASHIGNYEAGTREPPLDVLLRYSRMSGVPVEVLIDDTLDLPEVLPAEQVYEWVPVLREKPRRSR